MALNPVWDILDQHFLHQLGTVDFHAFKFLGGSLYLELPSLAGGYMGELFPPT